MNFEFLKLTDSENAVYQEKCKALNILKKYNKFSSRLLDIFSLKEIFQPDAGNFIMRYSCFSLIGEEIDLGQLTQRLYDALMSYGNLRYSQERLEADNIPEEFIVDLSKNIIKELSEQTPINCITEIYKFLSHLFKDQKDRDAMTIVFLKLVTLPSSRKQFFVPELNRLIAYSEYCEEAIMIAKEKDFDMRTTTGININLALLNNSIDKTTKIVLIKKNFKLKGMTASIEFLSNNLEDFDDLDVFIETTILQNNRITKKSAAIGKLLFNMFGRDIINRTVNYDFQDKLSKNKYKNFKEFTDKYSKIIDFKEFGENFPASLTSGNLYGGYKNDFKIFMTNLISGLSEKEIFKIKVRYHYLFEPDVTELYNNNKLVKIVEENSSDEELINVIANYIIYKVSTRYSSFNSYLPTVASLAPYLIKNKEFNHFIKNNENIYSYTCNINVYDYKTQFNQFLPKDYNLVAKSDFGNYFILTKYWSNFKSFFNIFSPLLTVNFNVYSVDMRTKIAITNMVILEDKYNDGEFSNDDILEIFKVIFSTENCFKAFNIFSSLTSDSCHTFQRLYGNDFGNSYSEIFTKAYRRYITLIDNMKNPSEEFLEIRENIDNLITNIELLASLK